MKNNKEFCHYKLLAARDGLEVIQGKWRIPIVIALTYGNKRFGEIRRDIGDISPKMLAKELKALEESRIITRRLYGSLPVTVEYSLTDLGHSMDKLLDEILNWGIQLRQEVKGKS